nr:hypothetical protein [uncultured Campylobacter sp.]
MHPKRRTANASYKTRCLYPPNTTFEAPPALQEASIASSHPYKPSAFPQPQRYKCELQNAQILKFKIHHADQKILKFHRFKSDKF